MKKSILFGIALVEMNLSREKLAIAAAFTNN